jgi:hypothetical protein
MLRTRHLIALVVLFWLAPTHGGWAFQEKIDGASDPQKSESGDDSGATIRGRIASAEDAPIEFDLTTLTVAIVEQIRYLPFPLPTDWGTRNEEQRKAWIEEFIASDEGLAFQAKREEQLKKQRRFPLSLEADGAFEVFDVPPGKYNLLGGKEVEVDSKTYAVEVFASIDVGDVDELNLEPLPIEFTRLLAKGESAPEVTVDALQPDQEPISLASFAGKPLLIGFWSADNPAAEHDLQQLQTAFEALSKDQQLNLWTICVDESPDKARTTVASGELRWPQGSTGGWQHPALVEYGVRSVPAYFLIGKDGRLLLSNSDVFDAIGDGSRDLTTVLRDALTEKTAPDGS